MGFAGNSVQGFRVYAWKAVPSFPQIALCFPSFALRPQPFWLLESGNNGNLALSPSSLTAAFNMDFSILAIKSASLSRVLATLASLGGAALTSKSSGNSPPVSLSWGGGAGCWDVVDIGLWACPPPPWWNQTSRTRTEPPRVRPTRRLVLRLWDFQMSTSALSFQLTSCWPGAKGFGSKRRKSFRWPSLPLDLRKWQGRVRFQCTQGLAGRRGWDKAGSGVLRDLFLTTSTTIGEWQWDENILMEYVVAQLFDDDGLCSRLSYMWLRVEDSKWKIFCEVVVRLEPNRDEGRRSQLMLIFQIRDLEMANCFVFW